MAWSSRRMEENAWTIKGGALVGSFSRRRLSISWDEVITSDPKERNVIKDIVKDKNSCKSFITNHSTRANITNRSQN